MGLSGGGVLLGPAPIAIYGIIGERLKLSHTLFPQMGLRGGASLGHSHIAIYGIIEGLKLSHTLFPQMGLAEGRGFAWPRLYYHMWKCQGRGSM